MGGGQGSSSGTLLLWLGVPIILAMPCECLCRQELGLEAL